MQRRRSRGVSSSIRWCGFAAGCALALAGALALVQTPSAAAASPTASATPTATAGRNPFDQSVHPLALGDVLPDASYIDQRGQVVSVRALRGRTLIIGFIYTNCNDQCPILTDKFGRLAAALPADRFELLEISIDPARDSHAAIANFARAHNIHAANWRVLGGAAPLVDSFAKPLGVSVIAGPGGELLHSERTVIAGPDGRIGELIDDAGWTPAQLIAAARHVDGLPSSGIARFDLELGKTVQAVCGGATAARSGIADLAGLLMVLVLGGLAALFFARRIFAG